MLTAVTFLHPGHVILNVLAAEARLALRHISHMHAADGSCSVLPASLARVTLALVDRHDGTERLRSSVATLEVLYRPLIFVSQVEKRHKTACSFILASNLNANSL